MKQSLALCFLLISAGCMLPAGAAEETEGWSGKAALGYLATTGNSETRTLNANVLVGFTRERWHHELGAEAIGADSNDQTTAERYRLRFKSKYDFTEHDYLFGEISWDKDKFSGYDQQIKESIGYGRRILNTDTQVLNFEVGLGARQSDLRDGSSENDAVLRVGGDYLWKFSDTASFTQRLIVESGSSNTFTESESAVVAALLEQLALRLSYTLRNNSDVPVGSDKTDTFTAVAIEYKF